MVIPGRARNEGVVEYAARLSKLYGKTQDSKVKKLNVPPHKWGGVYV